MEQDKQKVKPMKNKNEAKVISWFHEEHLDLLVTAQLFGFQLLFVLPGFIRLAHLQTAGNNYGWEPSCFSEVSVLWNKTQKK